MTPPAPNSSVLAIATSPTVAPNQVIINGDSATVPLSAIQHAGTALTPSAGLKDESLVRINGQWYIMPN